MYNSAAHYRNLYETVPREFSFDGRTPAEVKQWQGAFRPRLRAALGLDNMAADLQDHTPTAELLDSEELDDHIRESWQIQVEPTVPLPFYLLKPKRVEGKLPLVLTPHGHNHPHIYAGIAHNEQEAQAMKDGERDIAVQAVREGYIAIAPTTRAFGETRTPKDIEDGRVSSCRIHLMHGLLVGRTPIGERVWDMSCLIDWALAHLPVDGDRIAMTGNSGGGTVTVFAAACETRISVSAPSCYFCTFQGSIGTLHHCDCNYVPGVMRLGEMYDVAGLIAPRPFVAIAGREDSIFPIQHAKAAYEELLQVYTAAGVPDRCRLYIGEGGHRYYKDGCWPFVREMFEEATQA